MSGPKSRPRRSTSTISNTESSSSEDDKDFFFDIATKKSKPAPLPSDKTRKKRSKIPTSTRKTPISSTLQNLFTPESKLDDKLSSDLGFDLASALAIIAPTETHKKLMDMVKQQEEIDEMIEFDREKSRSRLAAYDKITNILETQICPEVYQDPRNADYIEELRRNLTLNNEEEIMDFYSLKNKGNYGEKIPGYEVVGSKEMIITKNSTFLIKQLLILDKYESYLDYIASEASISKIKSISEISTVQHNCSIGCDHINKFMANLGFNSDELLQKAKTGHHLKVELVLDSKIQLPSTILQVLKFEILVKLILCSPVTDFTEVDEICDSLLRIIIILMSDARINDACDGSYGTFDWNTESSLGVLNRLLNSVSQWYFNKLQLDNSTCFKYICQKFINMLDLCFSTQFQLVFRVIYNLNPTAVPVLKYLKNWLMFYYVVNQDHNDVYHFNDDEDRMLEYKIFKQSLVTFDLPTDTETKLTLSLYHFLRIFTKCELNSVQLKSSKTDLEGDVINPSDYKSNKHAYYRLRCRIRFLEMLIMNHIKDFVLLSKQHAFIPDTKDNTKSSMFSIEYKEPFDEIQAGVPREEALIYRLRAMILSIKATYFRNFRHFIVPVITDCTGILTAIVSRLDKELSSPDAL